MSSRVSAGSGGGYVVLSRDPLVRGNVVNASAAAGRLYMIASDGEQLLAMIESVRPRVVVIDRESGDGLAVLRRIATLPARDQMLVLMVVRDVAYEAFPGAHLIVFEPALGETLAMIDRRVEIERGVPPVALDRLLSLSLLSGHLDTALENAADRIAEGFGVDRCIVSVRGDSSGGAAVGAHTWDSLAWNHTADRCRAATMSQATLIAPGQRDGAQVARCESYLAVQLETPHGSHGFVGLVVARARIFGRSDRSALEAIASRLGAELGWRTVHERTAEELDRHVNRAGLDNLLGIWNRAAMFELGAMLVSSARRAGQPLTAIVIDVTDLQSINTRHGHEVGDRLLRRIADALRATVRTEDLCGRWAGDKLAIVLSATAIEGAQRMAQRLQAALAARPLDLPNGGVLPIPVAIGLAPVQSNEEFPRLMQRASWAAGKAQEGEAVVASASIGPVARLSQQIDVEEVRATLGGSYRLLHEISRGGMGVVYRAEDLALERPVAIKMLRPDLGEDTQLVEQLRREAAMLARLQHPNLVQIYNFGQTGGDSYFVMELVEGEGLMQAVERHRAERTQIPTSDLANMIEQIASALDALHERGIVHRDVKPANVIRDPFRNRSVLVDVGIARKYGQFVESAGTPGYIAPEVIGGREATPRSDVYGLAATAYMTLTLRAPWGDEDYATILARQTGDATPPPPSTLRPDLSEAVDEVLLGALDRDPEKRPGTAGVFARSLIAALAVAPPQAARDGSRWAGNTILPSRAVQAAARTRGVVYRSITRALGIREAERLRDAIGGDHPELARALTDTTPLAWLPTEQFVRILDIAPDHVGRDRTSLARDVARATVRASFRRFFPASAATLVPDRTLSAIRNVWSRYQTWGAISSLPISSTEHVVRMTQTLHDPDLCAWVDGLLHQLVVLSGGATPTVSHEACEVRGDDACLFRVMWVRAE